MINDEPPEASHSYFPDQWWPYPVMTAGALVTLGLLAYAGRSSLAPGQPASPGLSGAGSPDWYFLFLHELLKLGPPAITALLLPVGALAFLLAWPLIDSTLGPSAARRLGWRAWPTPRHNVITGAIWVVGLSAVLLLTLWGLAGPGLCLPWFYQGPVCG